MAILSVKRRCWLDDRKVIWHPKALRRQFLTMTKVIWQKVESLLVCIRQVAAAICNCMF